MSQWEGWVEHSSAVRWGRNLAGQWENIWAGSCLAAFLEWLWRTLVYLGRGSVLARVLVLDPPATLPLAQQSLAWRVLRAIYRGILRFTLPLGSWGRRLASSSLFLGLAREHAMVASAVYLLGCATVYARTGSLLLTAILLGLLVAAWIYLRPELGILYICLFVPVELALINTYLPYNAKYTVEAVLAVMTVALLVRVFFLGEVRLAPASTDIPLAVLLAVGVLSIVANRVPVFTGIAGLRAFLQFALLYVIIVQIKPSRSMLWRLVVLLLALATILALYGWLQKLTGVETPPSWVDPEEDISTRVFGTMANPNTFGGFLLAFIPPALALALTRGENWGWRSLAGMAALIMAGALAFTYSRGAMLGLVAAILYLGLVRDRRLLLGLLLAALLVPAVMPGILDRIAFGFSSDYLSQSSYSGRIFAWMKGLEVLSMHPWLGVGPGRFGGAVAKLMGSPAFLEVGLSYWQGVWLDNQIVQVAAELGLVGLAVFAWFLVTFVRSAYQIYHREASPRWRAIIAGMTASFIGLLIQSFVAGIWEIHQTALFIWLFMGIIMSLEGQPANGDDHQLAAQALAQSRGQQVA